MAETASPPSKTIIPTAIDLGLLFILCGPPLASLGVSLKRLPFYFLTSIAASSLPTTIKTANVHDWYSLALIAVALVFTYAVVLGALYFNLDSRVGHKWKPTTSAAVDELSPLANYIERNKALSPTNSTGRRFPWPPLIAWLIVILTMAASNAYLLHAPDTSTATMEEVVSLQVTQDAIEVGQLPLCFLAVTLGFWFLRLWSRNLKSN